MRRIERSTKFKRDYKRERRTHPNLDQLLADAVRQLASDETLPARYRDHALTSQWQGFRDCHLKPDLVLIYEKPNSDTLVLVRIGSHAELFG